MCRWLILVLLGLLLLAACAPAEVEPGFSGPLPITRGPTGMPTPYPTATLYPTFTPLPPRPDQPPEPYPAAPWVTAEPYAPHTPQPPRSYPAPTPATGDPQPTFTPVPPLPGLLYATVDGLWQIGGDWQPVLLTSERQAQLSPDGTMALYEAGDDIWLLELASGRRRNLTEGQGRDNCCPQWWPARPETIIFGSWENRPADSDPGTGYLSAVQLDGSDYQVLVDAPSLAPPAPGPDGQTIAYDQSKETWLYRLGQGSSRLNPFDYDLEPGEMGSPAWSPGGRFLAWNGGSAGLVVFDLENQVGWRLHPYEVLGRGGWFAPPAWSTDDRWLAFRAEDARPEAHGIWVAAVDGSAEHYLGPGTSSVVWSPDGRWLAFSGPPAGALDQSPVGWLVEVGSWYQIRIGLPPGSQIVGWTTP
jgi:hypothetical protein